MGRLLVIMPFLFAWIYGKVNSITKLHYFEKAS